MGVFRSVGTSPVSCDGDGKTVELFPRVLHARHLGVDREAISGFTVELLQDERKRKKENVLVFTADQLPNDTTAYSNATNTLKENTAGI